MVFNTQEIAKRQGLAGFQGLRYAPDVTKFVNPEKLAMPKPTFKKSSVMETLPENAQAKFTQESVEYSRFIDAKKNLAGNRDVSEFEDREVLQFDPVSDYTKEKAGFSTYDSGKFQGGMSGESRLSGKAVNYVERVGTLEKPDPYHVSLNKAIRIRT